MRKTRGNWTRGIRRIGGLAALALLAAATPHADASAQDQGRLVSYVAVGSGGAKARNLYDDQGLVVLEIPSGMVLAVHGERSGWLEVEVPGGFRVWVFGEYVRPAAEAGVLQITGDNVRMRPLPSSGPESLPLRQLLAKGDRVRLIQRHDASLELREDWVQVWSPPGARAWVRASETVPLPAGADGPKLWAAASVGALQRPPQATSKGQAVPAAAPATKATAEARQVTDLMQTADARLRAEREVDEAGGTPDYAGAIAAYEAVLKVSDGGPTADVARGRIRLAQSYAEAHALREELENEKAALDSALAKREEERTAARERDVYEGRFASRGWLESAPVLGGDPVWVLRWSGDRVAEVVCTSGRYDLSLFAGFEIGIDGDVLRGPLLAADQSVARPQQVDVRRIEVLAGRQTRPTR